MGDNWQLQEAKNKLSLLVKQTRSEHPQFISGHGQEAVVVISQMNIGVCVRRTASCLKCC